MLKEFKKFISRGNVIDLAVGVIIGGAFGKIVSSLVNDILMPFIGVILGGHDFSNLVLKINDSTIAYGSFIQNIVDFVIIAFTIFVMIKIINKFKDKKEEEKKVEKPKKTNEEKLLEEIRNILKKK
ncbi:MAG: large-conductance mechanosensitive channel protein MscL [Bacilli bacterium]|jgi:large conductance mechanosensitive channel|nr:large-conductance mechanosensitive channel protein MscL [Bacilli bacterium]